MNHDPYDRPEPPPGYRLQSEDSTWEVERLQVKWWRDTAPWVKGELLERTIADAHLAIVSGLRTRYPHADDRELFYRVAAMHAGPELVRAAYGWVDPETDD